MSAATSVKEAKVLIASTGGCAAGCWATAAAVTSVRASLITRGRILTSNCILPVAGLATHYLEFSIQASLPYKIVRQLPYRVNQGRQGLLIYVKTVGEDVIIAIKSMVALERLTQICRGRATASRQGQSLRSFA